MLKELLAGRVECLNNSEISEFMSLIGQGDIISFAGGIPDRNIFPLKELRELLNSLMTEPGGPDLFQYGSTEGSGRLKEYIISFLKKRNIQASEEEILITTGSQQALDLLSKIFIDPGDRVLVENPGYVGGLGAIRSYQADITGINLVEDGIEIDLLEEELAKGRRFKFIYLVPDFSNPSGIRLSLPKRKALLELAGKYGFYIIEDTPYSELNYYNEPLPTLKELDSEGRVIYLGTFSKFFIPGLRIGWICGDREIIRLAGLAKQNTDLTSNSLGQELIAVAGEKGLIETQIKRAKPHYRSRLEEMGQALEKYFPKSTSWLVPKGGFFYWIRLPEYIESRRLLKKAFENRVAFVTGNSFLANPEEGNNYLRLSFSNCPQEDIETGIKILGEIITNWQDF